MRHCSPMRGVGGADPNQREVSSSSSIPLLYVMSVPGLFHGVPKTLIPHLKTIWCTASTTFHWRQCVQNWCPRLLTCITQLSVSLARGYLCIDPKIKGNEEQPAATRTIWCRWHWIDMRVVQCLPLIQNANNKRYQDTSSGL